MMPITHDVEGSGPRCCGSHSRMSPRLTRIQASFEVRFAHPRRLSSPEAQELRAILQEFRKSTLRTQGLKRLTLAKKSTAAGRVARPEESARKIHRVRSASPPSPR